MSEVSSAAVQGLSSQTFLTALITNATILCIEIVAFVILKHKLARIYEPRTYLPPPEKRAANLPGGPWRWLLAIITIPTGDVLHKNGLDAYMFLRFLRMLVILFSSITFLTWAVLLPVNAVNVKNARFTDGLSKLSWGNIPLTAHKRYAAHIIVVYISTFFTLWLVRRELVHYTEMRQAFLTSKSHSRQAQARTVLITSIPLEMCNEKSLKLWASFVPGGIQNIWIYRDTSVLNKEYNDRLDACKKLEGASAQLISHVVRAKMARDKQEAKARKRAEKKEKKEPLPPDVSDAEKGQARFEEDNATITSVDSMAVPLRPRNQANDLGAGPSFETYEMTLVPSRNTDKEKPTSAQLEGFGPGRQGSTKSSKMGEMIRELVPPHKRPHHRVGPLGLFGRKVDTIEWCKDEIARLNKSIEVHRSTLGETKPLGSAFIQCNLQLGAHVLAQCVSFHQPLMMSQKLIEIDPKDVIWDNIDDGVYETRFRYLTSWLGSLALIILWFVPVAFVGTLSNVTELCQSVSWLCWIKNAPKPVPGLIQGILPPLLLAILFAVLPYLLKGLAWYENIPRWSLLSMSVYKRYYLFLVIHGFLVVTLSSSITSTIHDIVANPTEAVSNLAAHLPDASIFFLTWTITQGLTGAGSALLQVGVLVVYFIKKWFLGRTPREAYAVTFLMPKADFGLVLPRISLLATIGLAYSVLSPIINGLAAVAFMLFFFAWKFLLTWVFDQPEEGETGGQYFPLAINFLFTGLYIEQFCLAVLFFLKIADGLRATFIAEGALMLALMGLTVTAQILFKQSFNPITEFLPMSLATKEMSDRWEREKQKKAHSSSVRTEDKEDKDDEIDLFSRTRLASVVRKRLKKPVQKLKKELSKTVAKTTRTSADTNSSGDEGRNPFMSPRPSLNAAPADGGNDGDEDKDFDENGFAHPSTYANQPWIWLPKDNVGVSTWLAEDYQTAGVNASDLGALMDGRGNVEVQRNPPDEEWVGGHDA